MTIALLNWQAMRAILALECLDPVLPAIGVSQQGAMLRGIVRELYSTQTTGALGKEELAQDFMAVRQAVDHRFGVAAAERLERWAGSVYTGLHSAQPVISSWNEAFNAWVVARNLPTELRPPEHVRPAILAMVNADRARDAEVTAAATAALDRRLTDYDLSVLVNERWLATEHPVTALGFAAGMRAFLEGWSRLIDPLPVATKRLLQELGVETLVWRGIDREYIALEPLTVPEVPTCL